MKRILFRWAAVVLALCCLSSGLSEGENAAEWMTFASRTEAYYSDAAKAYTLPLYAGETIAVPVGKRIETGDTEMVSFSVPEDALYELWFQYETETQSALPSEMTVTVDGEIPFYELRRVKLKSFWTDDGVFPLDRYGNEIATTPSAQRVLLEAGITDSAGWTDSPFLFALGAGEHQLGLSMQEGAVTIEQMTVRAKAAPATYAGQTADGNALIVIEAENITSRNKSSIRAAGEFDPNLTPYETEHRRMNFLDGASFDAAGDEVSWQFAVEKEGWYQLGFRYRQSVKTDFPVFADVLVDGALPSDQASRIPFDYASAFSTLKVKDSSGALQTFYLSGGEHTLTLRLNGSLLLPVYEVINRVLGQINGLSLEVVRLTGGVTTDRYRDYELLTYIPDLVEILNGWASELEETVDKMKVYSATGSGSAFSNLTLAADQLRRLALKPEDLPRRLSELSTGSNSAARMLAQQLQDIAQNDLSIDQIYWFQKDAELPKGVSFFTSAAKGAERFVTSFGSQDYAVGTGKEGHLQVWMGRSRQYLEIVQNMVDSMFTPETGIEVDLSIMPDANKLVLANAAGTAPDVVLSLQYVVPSYLNIRGALYDLTKFEDFPEIAQRFSSGLFIPYTLGEGIYAMPETVNFWVQFYRKDILNALNISVPDNLEQVKMMLPELQRRNMNYYFPTAGMVGMKVFPGTLPLILQSGGSIYGETIGDTTLDSEESLKGFILDLAEFALGSAETEWGALRCEMGHPEPFDLRYLAIGNENWADVYFSRYEKIRNAVKAVYPSLTCIVACGPVADGSLFNASRSKILRSFPDDTSDEHYYMESDWFLRNTHRYDAYPRSSPVFLGEYAAHEPAVGGRRPNNLYSALCEAAYLTGIERNSDVVVMCCYAPLLARFGMDQWTPDLIWFNGTQVVRTPNYYIQQMFASTLGDQLLQSAMTDANGKNVVEASAKLYQVASKTSDGRVYVKVVNVSGEEKTILLQLQGVEYPDGTQGEMLMLAGEKQAVNSLSREAIAPQSSRILFREGIAEIVLPSYSAAVITLP